MLTRTRLALPGLVLTAMLGACEDDPVGPTDGLTPTEALSLFKSLGEIPGFSTDPDEDLDPTAVDTTVACLLGGEAKVVGTRSAQVGVGTIEVVLEAVVTPTGCKVSGDGLTFTVDGDPNFRKEVRTDFIDLETIVMAGGVEGKIRWQLEDRSGDCAIDLALDATGDLSDIDNPRVTGGYEGKMCGQDIELDISRSPDGAGAPDGSR